MIERVKSKLIWLIILASTLTACGPLKDIGKGLGDLLKGITSPGN
jgi:hypothetical protein